MNRNILKPTIEDIDIKEVCLDILRDLYSASRQLIMYPMGHPITNDTLIKPLNRLNTIFSFKKSFVIQVYNGRLVCEGLLLENIVFVEGLIRDFEKHDIAVVEFSSELILADLYHFLSGLLEGKSPAEDYFSRFLEKKGITTIRINKAKPSTLFDFDDTLIGLPNKRFMLYDRIREILNKNTQSVIDYYLGKINSDYDAAALLGVDLRLAFLDDHFAFSVSSMTEEQALEIFSQVIYSTNWLGVSTDKQALDGISRLWRDYAGLSEDVSILLPIYDIFKSVGATDTVLESVFDKGTILKLKAVRDAEEIVELLKSNQAREIDFQELRKTVFKLASDKYSQPLEQLIGQLLKSLSSMVLDTRQRSLRLSAEAIGTLIDGAFWDIYSDVVKETLRLAFIGRTGFEMIEFIGWNAEKSAEASRWEELKICAQTLQTIAGPSTDEKNKLAHDKLAELAESPIINDILVDAVLSGKGGTELYEAISIIASQKVAAVLVEKIDSPDKTIRVRIIKSLTLMGKEIGPEVIKKLAEIVSAGESDDDNSWYRLRNLLRVIGKIKYIEALPYFDVLTRWRQTRIKLELISACESMGSSATGVLLTKLAMDEDLEVRKAAIIALGMSGHPDMLKYLRSLFNTLTSERYLIVIAIGRIDGFSARDMLIEFYENPDIYKNLNITKKEEQKIKVAILRSLSAIGDDVSKSKIELYSKKGKNKLFKKDVLSETAMFLINAHKK